MKQTCHANRLACRGKLAACVATSLVAYSVTSICVAAVVSVYLASGTTWQTAALTCGVSAETLHTASRHCQ